MFWAAAVRGANMREYGQTARRPISREAGTGQTAVRGANKYMVKQGDALFGALERSNRATLYSAPRMERWAAQVSARVAGLGAVGLKGARRQQVYGQTGPAAQVG